MAGLLSDLNLGAGALLAQQAGVAVTGRNVANVNTPGYQRESIDLRAEPAAPLVGGVTAGNALRSSDDLLSARERTQATTTGRAQSLSTSLHDLEQQLAGQSSDLTGSLGSFFGSLGALQGAPGDTATRNQLLTSAQTVASQFNSAAKTIADAQTSVDWQLVPLAATASGLAQQIATANQALGTHPDPILADARDLAAQKLAALTGGQARIDPDGKMSVVLANGTSLVNGDRASTLQTAVDPTNSNHYKIMVVDGARATDVTQVVDGQMGGLVAFRDGTAAQAASDVDQLAYDFATKMNAVHSANVGLDGGTGRNLYTPPAAVAGAAAALAVDPTVLADPRKLATRSPGAGVGDDGGVSALLALRDQPLAGGGTRSFTDESMRSIEAVGSAAQNAASDLTLQSARTDTLASARDSVSGVSQEEETARLSQFQHAAEAASQYVSVVNQLLQTLLQNL